VILTARKHFYRRKTEFYREEVDEQNQSKSKNVFSGAVVP
jgi:hypothetical protein